MDLRLRLKGAVTWCGDPIRGERVASMLGALAEAGPRGASVEELVDMIWADELPLHPAKALQILISRARSQTSAEAIVRTRSGYRLALPEESVDVWALDALSERAERALADGDARRASELAEEALELDDDSGARRTALIATSRQGQHSEAFRGLRELSRSLPYDEELAAEYLRAQSNVEGPAAALASFARIDQRLVDDLGSRPGPRLREAHEELLAMDRPIRAGVRTSASSLLGREYDVDAVTGLLSTTRLVTIVGTGGLGKTRLAHEVARHSPVPRVYVVELASIRQSGEVMSAISEAVRMRETVTRFDHRIDAQDDHRIDAQDLRARVLAALSDGPNLLVLDNCEHVIDGVAGIVNDLLGMVTGLRVLATSRSPMRLSAEHAYLLDRLPAVKAQELFVERARAARPTVTLDDGTVAALVDGLDGLPLAIELAAARTRTHTPASILEHLSDRFGLLTGGDRAAPGRHQTLQRVIDWSWQLLDDDARDALMAVSLLPDAFGMECAEGIFGPRAVSTVDRLVDQSLLAVVERGGQARFRMLETIREYGQMRLKESDRRDRLESSVHHWAVSTCEAAAEDVFGVHMVRAVAALRDEEHNLAHALRLLLDRDDDRAVVMLAALLPYWMVSGKQLHILMHLSLIERFVGNWTMPNHLTEYVRRVLAVETTTWGMLPRWQQLPASARLLGQVGTASEDPIIRAMACLGSVIIHAADASRTSELVPSLMDLTESADRLTRVIARPFLARITENAGQVSDSIDLLEKTIADLDTLDPPWLATRCHETLSQMHLQHGDFEAAREHAAAALPILVELGDSVQCRAAIAFSELGLGRLDRAEAELNALAATEDHDEPFGHRHMLLLGQAELALLRGDVVEGLDLLAAVRESDWSRTPSPGLPASDGLEAWNLLFSAVSTVVSARYASARSDEDFARLAWQAEQVTAEHRTHYDFPVLGSVAFALAACELLRGGDGATAAGGSERIVRLMALARRLDYNRGFPSLSWRYLADGLTAEQSAQVDAQFDRLAACSSNEVVADLHECAGVISDSSGRT